MSPATRMRWRDCLSLVRSDIDRLVQALCDAGVPPPRRRWKFLFTAEIAALALYRASHCAYRRGGHALAGFLYRMNITLTGVDIHPSTEIGPRCLLAHPVGTILFGRFGEELTVYARVVVNCDTVPPLLAQAPQLGDRVLLGSMASVLGRVEIASDVKIAPGSLIDFSIPERNRLVRRFPGEKTVSTPARTADAAME